MLTQKQELAVEYRVQGDNQTQAVMRAFDCKNKDSAKAIASRLFNTKEVNERLTEKQGLLDAITIDNVISFQDQLTHKIPYQDVVAKLQKLMTCGDKRVELSAIQEYNKINGLYKGGNTKAMDMFEDLRPD